MKSNDINIDVRADHTVSMNYAMPGNKYPITTRAAARSSMASAKGKPEYGTVAKAACRKYPDLPGCNAVKT
jgi:hypothetical protein